MTDIPVYNKKEYVPVYNKKEYVPVYNKKEISMKDISFMI